ncbi:MAG TPA: LOG family protein [Longilinea sp.]|nr:LOG family protein [Longilinea sp.]
MSNEPTLPAHSRGHQRITVFGGSKPRPGDPAYQEAYQLGVLIGKAGYTALTGGYMGVMEAVSRGANEAGGHVIGATCEEIEHWRPTNANAWVKEEWCYPTLIERLNALIEHCDAALALPGGVGTMAEVSVMWNRMLIGSVSPRPLVVIGPEWESTFEHFLAELGSYIPEHDQKLLGFAPDFESGFEQVQQLLA